MEVVEPIRSRETLGRFLDYLRRRSSRHEWQRLRNYLLALTGIYSGLRISDLRKLRARDVRGTHLVIRTTKTQKRVQILIAGPLRQALNPFIAELDDDEYLFRSRQGWNKPITRSRCYQILRDAAEACGLPRIGTHSMRKTFGWFFYAKHKDVAMLQKLFGHQDPSVTLRYIGVLQSDLDDVMRGFSITD